MKPGQTKILVPGFGHVRLAPRGKKGIYSASFYYKGKHCRKTLKTADEATAIQRAASVVRASIDFKPIEFSAPAVSFQGGFETYLQYLKSNRSSPQTIQQFRLRNKAFLDYLLSIDVNSFGEIKPTLKEVNRILENVADRYIVPISALAFLGCRTRELTSILQKDVDRDRARVLIRKPEKYKSKTTTHLVPIHPRLEEIISSYQRPRSKWYFCSLPYKRDRKGGKKLQGKMLNQEFKRAAEAAGLKTGIRVEGGMTLHSLRGFFKSHALLSGVPREVVDTWQAHCADRSASFVHYFDLPEEASQKDTCGRLILGAGNKSQD